MTEETHEDEMAARAPEADASPGETEQEDAQIYELGYHLVPSLSESELALRVEALKQAVGNMEGEHIADGGPVSEELAYAMRKMIAGKWHAFERSYFGWLKFAAVPQKVHAWKQTLEKDEQLIRYLLVKTVREDTMAGPTLQEVRPLARTTAQRLTDAPEKDAKPVSEEELDKRLGEIIEGEAEAKPSSVI